MSELVELLKTGGPWTLMVVSFAVTSYLYREVRDLMRENAANVKQHVADLKSAEEKHAKDKQELNNRLIAMTEKQVEVLTMVSENQRQQVRLLRSWNDDA
jgi:hypothetical protein